MALPIAGLLTLGGELLKRVIKDPAQLDEAKFKMAELAQSGELQEMANATKLFELEVQDRASARDMAKTVGIDTQRNLAYGILVIWTTIQLCMLFGVGKDLDPVVLSRIGGQADAALVMALMFFLGSSKGSKDKDLK